MNIQKVREALKDCDTIVDFKFDSENGIITINGSKPLISVTDIKIERKQGERYSEVTLKFDADVTVSGRMILESMISLRKMEQIEDLLRERY